MGLLLRLLRRPRLRSVLVHALLVCVMPVVAQAQSPGATPPAGGVDAPAPPPTDADVEPPAAPARVVVPATGYSYGPPTSHAAERPRARAARPDSAGSDATAGFETLADGSTRLFVELSKAVTYDTKPGRNSITYVLKGARADGRNNQNPLVTVHFNTPITSARLTPHGRDLWLIVDLRANVQPTASMGASKVGAAVLSLDFPKGDYLTRAAPVATPSGAPSAEAKVTPPASPVP